MAERGSILKDLFPGIVQRKHKFFEDSYCTSRLHTRAQHHNFLVATYLTSDQFEAHPMRLLSLLNVRAHRNAEDWVAYDVLQTKSGCYRLLRNLVL